MLVQTVATSGQYIRTGPGTGYRAVAVVYPKHQLTISDTDSLKIGNNIWIKVSFGSVVGWAYGYYLRKVTTAPTPPPPSSFPFYGLKGLHGPADPGLWPWDGQLYNDIRTAKIKAVKLLAAGDMDGSVVNALRSSGVEFIMARLFAKFHTNRTPVEFVSEVYPATKRLYDAGVRYFEVHNEPNLHTQDSPEGMWIAWQNGKEFGAFFWQVTQLLKSVFPEIKLGFPGVSPGWDIPGIRYDSSRFLTEADNYLKTADFICMHTYWNEVIGLSHANSWQDINAFARKYPTKLIFVSEFSNSNTNNTITKEIKGKQYAEFYQSLKTLPSNVGAAFCYVYSSSGGYQSETWRNSAIPSIVGTVP